MLELNSNICGFTVKRSVSVPEIKATLFELEHVGCGARLTYLDREDENKSFAIAFKTLPSDDTGVFHIIEHSVLCGSDKYTTKEPFVDLLKKSLNTFLNAMTYPDKTVYPVASRNDKDFLNLVSVYMDAVLHPAMLKNPNIFRQEGWHYELDSREGELKTSGVVLNEMRGAYSASETHAAYHLANMLFGDTCYAVDSGGNPESITNLTYEDFVAAHNKFYHPSSAEIFLDGSVELESVLSLLDSYLSEYDRREGVGEIPTAVPAGAKFREIEYEIAPSEDPAGKTRIAMGYGSYPYSDNIRRVWVNVIIDALLSTNESPLKKKLLDSGLCEEVAITPYDSIKENALMLELRNVKDGKESEIIELFNTAVAEICKNGIDRELLEASLNSYEFKMREKDFGRFPKGLVFVLTMLESTLYGGDALDVLSFEYIFKAIREELTNDAPERILRELFIDNNRRATLVMRPSATLGEEKAAAERERLAKIKATLTDEELDEIIRVNRELKEWQQTPDTPEDTATIPSLDLADISEKAIKLPEEISEIDGVTVLSHNVPTDGITYAELYFDVSELDENELFDLKLLTSLIGSVKTETHTALELQNLVKRDLGSFDFRISCLPSGKDTKIYAVVEASALDSGRERIVDLIKEVLYTSDFSDLSVMQNTVRQLKMGMEDSFTAAGHAAGAMRCSAYVTSDGAVAEYISGYEAFLKLKALLADFDTKAEKTVKRITALTKRIYPKERLTLSITAEPSEEFAKSVISAIECGGAVSPVCKIAPLGVRREGIVVPSEVAYAALGSHLSLYGEERHGSLYVVRSILSYGHLWGQIRVQGGAYGAGFMVGATGSLAYYSYRDPSPARSIGVYKESAEFLREFAKSGEDISGFIIGAIGEASPLYTPRLLGSSAAAAYLKGVSYEDRCRTRREMLNTSSEDLLRAADLLDKVASTEAICIVAGKEKLDTCSDIIDTVLEI